MENGIPARVLELRNLYRTGKNNLATDFFEPCLSACTQYRRAAGFFSSSALKTWAQGLPRLLRDDVAIKLLISPKLSADDASAMEKAIADETRFRVLERAADELIAEAIRFSNDPDDQQLQLKLFCWMIASGHIEIRFAIPRHMADAGMFHDKFGVFDFPSGHRIGFNGSANETFSGHQRNFERVHVYRSWIEADIERLEATVEDFDIMWNQRDDNLLVAPLSTKTLDLIRSNASAPTKTLGGLPRTDQPTKKWRHQEEALQAFITSGSGVLEMATGTGKTRTALKILAHLVDSQQVNCAILCTVGNDLLTQWHKEILAWRKARSMQWRVYRHFEAHHENELFAADPIESLIILSRQQLPGLLRKLSSSVRSRCMIIHDEVHGLGSESNIRKLQGEHKTFPFKLGLSATPEREYDASGTDFILEELGPIIFRFNLEDAIARGILCEMDYLPLPYELSDSDRKRLQAVHARRAASAKTGVPMSDEEFYNALASVYKTAEYKPLVFKHFLLGNPDILERSIVFVDNRDFGDSVLQIIAPKTHLYRTYYAEDNPTDLIDFAAGKIDCLITCHRISQGIDIRSLTTVILFASSRSRLETIQRIGRCLRSDPDDDYKRAIVVDFILDGYRPDNDRNNWLTELSKIKRSE
ncbi:DEAD/DEAH box helicase family protein [Oxalobacteraceae sp. CFBP 8763]|nr:DEAD/DEAH box helicase family protein [Oxalobacteraceae sp. CFBP 8763]